MCVDACVQVFLLSVPQMEAIRAQIETEQPLIGDRTAFTVLSEQYKDNPKFLPKIEVRARGKLVCSYRGAGGKG